MRRRKHVDSWKYLKIVKTTISTKISTFYRLTIISSFFTFIIRFLFISNAISYSMITFISRINQLMTVLSTFFLNFNFFSNELNVVVRDRVFFVFEFWLNFFSILRFFWAFLMRSIRSRVLELLLVKFLLFVIFS
jgi:hypothetical protein